MSFAKIRPRRGTANQWNNANPILAEGEIGIEVPSTGVGTGTVKIKFGDGSSHWNDLPYGLDTPNDVSDVISSEFIAGTPCTSGNYYIANNKLYKCIADTDGSINVTNSNYFEETSVAGEVKTLNGRLTQSIDVINKEHNSAWFGVVAMNNETKLITFSVTIMNLPNGSVLYINKDIAPSADTFFYSMMDGNNKVSLQFYRDGRVVLAQLNNDMPIVNTTINGMYISH